MTEHPHSDEMLIKLISAGDKQAFTTLYRRYWDTLFTTTARVLRSKEEAGDVLQDVFLSLWNRRHELEISGSVLSYLHASVRYKAIHYIQKNITRHNYISLLSEASQLYLPVSGEGLEIKEMQEIVDATVAGMPPKMRKVYELSRKYHLSHREISERLGISDETVKKHIQHALQEIRLSLIKTGASPILWLFLLNGYYFAR